MREFRSYGSVRGALSNERPYRDPCFAVSYKSMNIAIVPILRIRSVSADYWF
jgi:hypothetical protein